MKNFKIYEPGDKMITLIKDNYSVLQALSAFGINLGFGDKTVSETCQMNGVDTYTFLAVINYTINGYGDFADDERISVSTLLHYLKASHTYYLDFQLPFIRRELQEALAAVPSYKGGGRGGNIVPSSLIMELYKDYEQEIRRHMKYEEKTLFPYVESLLADAPSTLIPHPSAIESLPSGRQGGGYSVETFSKHHGQTDQKLRELKLMIIKYLPADAHHNNQLTATLYDIYNNEEWLRQHAEVEDHIFTPAIRRLEQQRTPSAHPSALIPPPSSTESPLSEREKDVIIGVVQGLQNKEIADRLCISVNTVITHRRNIARKLQIHSPAGLTIYAIANNLISRSLIYNT